MRPELDLIFQTRAGGIAEAVARPAVLLLEEALSVPGVVIRDAPLDANLLVQVLGQGLARLDHRLRWSDYSFVPLKQVAQELIVAGGAKAVGRKKVTSA